MNVLVLGGAGYVGSHAVDMLVENNYNVVVIDNLSTGHIESLSKHITFYEGDCRDYKFLNKVFHNEKIDLVMHFCAYSLVSESYSKPLKYFNNNIQGLQVLLEVMLNNNVKKIIFSSTAAVYGNPKELPIQENHPLNPSNPYGESKKIMEQIVEWVSKIHGIKYVVLRYFNVAGAKPNGQIGEVHNPETHLIPLVLDVALKKKQYISIFGTNHETIDGTCVRDYLHITDLIKAHLQSLEYLESGGESNVFNLGNAKGYSVLEIVETAREVTGQKIPVKAEKRRKGDPSILIASNEKAKKHLGFEPEITDIKEIIKTSWNFHKTHQNGYEI